MVMDVTEFYTFTPGRMTWTFIEVHSCFRIKIKKTTTKQKTSALIFAKNFQSILMNFIMLPQAVGLLKFMLDIFHTIIAAQCIT